MIRERIGRLVRVADRWQEEIFVAANGGIGSELTQEDVDRLLQRINALIDMHGHLLDALAAIEEEVL